MSLPEVPVSSSGGPSQRDVINGLITKLAKIGDKGEDMAASAEQIKATAGNVTRILGQVEAALNELVGMCRGHVARGSEVEGLVAQLRAADAEQAALINRIQGNNQEATEGMIALGEKAAGIEQAVTAAKRELGGQAGGGRRRRHRTRRGGFVYGKAKRVSRRGKRLSKRKQRG